MIQPNMNQPNMNQPNMNQPNMIQPNMNQPNSKNSNTSLNTKVLELSNQLNQLNQLTSHIDMDSNNKNNNKNQFEVNKNNTIKRNKLTVIQPPLSNNFKQKQGDQINTNINNQHSNSNSNSNSGPSVKPINQLFGFLQNEMSGFSDGYAYINIDNPLPKSFLPPDKDMEIYTAPEGEKIDKRKQEEIIKIFESERTNEKNYFTQAINELNSKIAMGDISAMPKWLGSNPNL
jgi:hypothetical protein